MVKLFKWASVSAMKLSIIVPVYNTAEYLPKCLILSSAPALGRL